MMRAFTLPSALRRFQVAVPLWVWAGRAGSTLTIAAALILAIVHIPPMRWLFVMWTISNALWLWYGWRMGSGSLVSAQAVFLAIDTLGVTHYWIVGNALWMRMFS
ncbi:hypothetical protein [Acidithiobacillus sp.]|uniref:hypothetical protein n=1 Tax=Acidithiobacillus sp. TaxID=1872118 RepID=UPI0025C08EA4|nr:hypothetical protein [Acidithiobacillus sp.]